ncbi:hypothetical protein SFRURICE_007603 [Spodoptera frugiperda]|nr:hypothetical protein SFRURICE_007603 [Spodoptera frugiperda]
MPNTCPNTLSYVYDGDSWTEYASYFVIIFKYVLEKNFPDFVYPGGPKFFSPFSSHKQGNSCKNQPALDSGYRACHVVRPPCQYNAWEPRYPTIAPQAVQYGKHGVQNLTLVDFYMNSLVYAERIGRASKFFSKTYLKIITK